ncbi:MAG: hypothetical protein AB8H86_14290 [Polyangiales bacterium]
MEPSTEAEACVLARIQQRLVRLYDLGSSPVVTPFLCDAEAAEAVGGDPGRGEVLLVAEEEDGVSLGLYVEPEALALLRRGVDVLGEGQFDAYCLAAEGVSHFVYLVYRHEQTRSVSELELELQAEVDKYATALLEGNGVGAIRARSQAIRERLYQDPVLADSAETLEGNRYRHAIALASRYTHRLERQHIDRGAIGELVAELRRFYRVGMREKLALASE